ncbi:MAG: hypothetical protein Q8936_07285 [Bacillota bacterium]|nr:hypothetical protein [Bacillota bacterium]
MAQINISMREFVILVEKNADYDRQRIRNINVINKNQLELTIGISQFLPSAKVLLVFRKYEKGKMYFNLISGDGVKILMSLAKELISKQEEENYFNIDKNRVVININKLLSDNLKGINIKDVSINEDQVYLSVNIR